MEPTVNYEGVILSGMRPTGDLHLGHFEAVLRNWLKLQKDYRCFYFVADWHAITTDTDTRALKKDSFEIVKDWLAFGIDPKLATIFIQSEVPEHAELSLALERLVNIGPLNRLPTFKAYLEHLAGDRKVFDEKGSLLQGDDRLSRLANAEVSVGFLTYPVLQAADILLYDTTHVPVGEDQKPHIELTRELAKRFNALYGKVFTIPEVMLSSNVVLLRGSDGRKMSKSYGNALLPTSTPEEIKAGVNKYVTYRKRLTDKGDPYECPVFDLHRAFNPSEEIEINKACRDASIRCVECKSKLPGIIADSYSAYRERRQHITYDEIRDILTQGATVAREVASRKMAQVKHHMLMDYK